MKSSLFWKFFCLYMAVCILVVGWELTHPEPEKIWLTPSTPVTLDLLSSTDTKVDPGLSVDDIAQIFQALRLHLVDRDQVPISGVIRTFNDDRKYGDVVVHLVVHKSMWESFYFRRENGGWVYTTGSVRIA